VLPVLLLAGFYALGFGLVAVLGWLAVWLWLAFSNGSGALELGAVAVATALGLVSSGWRILRVRPEPPGGGQAVDEDEAPQLWALVRELAALADTRPPEQIRLVAEANAFVWEDGWLLGLRPGRRQMYVGVPLLRALTVDGLRAVLAHELGHYAHEHAHFCAVAHRGMQVVLRTVDAVGKRTLAGVLLTGYAVIYLGVSRSVRRRMELEADAVAVRAVGRAAFGDALQKTVRASAVWQCALAAYARRTRTDGAAPHTVLDDFAARLDQPSAAAPGTPERPGWHAKFDSHPPLQQRLAAINRLPDVDRDVAVDHRPATVLVPGDLAGPLRSSDFNRRIERVASSVAETDADVLYTAVHRLSDLRRHGLGGVLDLLGEGRAGELQTALGDDHLTEFVFAAAANELLDARARWEHRWGEPLRLVDTGQVVRLWPAVEAAVRDPDQVRPLRKLLLARGVWETHVAAWSHPGQFALDTGTLSHTPPGNAPLTTSLLLPDELYVFAVRRSGRYRVPSSAVSAGLAAATLAELRLRGRLQVDDDGHVIAISPAPTGDRFLDSVLERLTTSPQRRTHRWLQHLGPDVLETVKQRVETWRLLDTPDTARRSRAEIRRAMDHDLDSRGAALASLLWATELAGPAFGFAGLPARLYVGRVAARDQLAMAVRHVLSFPSPTP
jgi:Zn-dependent protease with chaperone function